MAARLLSGIKRSWRSAVCTSWLSAAERRARGYRIGGIRRHQQRRLVAAPHRALETGRHFDAEQHAPAGQQPVELSLVTRDLGDLEIFGIL